MGRRGHWHRGQCAKVARNTISMPAASAGEGKQSAHRESRKVQKCRAAAAAQRRAEATQARIELDANERQLLADIDDEREEADTAREAAAARRANGEHQHSPRGSCSYTARDLGCVVASVAAPESEIAIGHLEVDPADLQSCMDSI